MSNRTTRLTALAWFIVAGALTGCQKAPESRSEAAEATGVAEPAQTAARQNQRATPPRANPAITEDAGASGIEAIAGRWRVVEAHGNEFPIISAIAEFHIESLSWSYRPQGAVGLDQLCREPVVSPLEIAAAKREFANDIRPLVDRPARAVNGSEPQQILCAAGGDWGPESGADFVTLSDGRIAMRWRDGASITLERIEQALPKQEMTREDFAADDYAQE